MAIPYYPGCTLSTKAKNYDRSGRAVAAALGMELEELPEWQCCGATFPLMLDDSMALIAPTRILYQAQQAGERDGVRPVDAIDHKANRDTRIAIETRHSPGKPRLPDRADATGPRGHVHVGLEFPNRLHQHQIARNSCW